MLIIPKYPQHTVVGSMFSFVLLLPLFINPYIYPLHDVVIAFCALLGLIGSLRKPHLSEEKGRVIIAQMFDDKTGEFSWLGVGFRVSGFRV